jgi:membrane protease YdiL (CAAX protease family)
MYKEFFDNFDATYLIPLSGLCVLGYWLLKTSLGRRALSGTRPRRNRMPPAFPWIFLLLWFCLTIVAVFIIDSLTAKSSDEKIVFIQIVAQALVNTAFGIGALITAKNFFARRLKGFGLNFRKIPKDIIFAFAYLFAVVPVVYAVLEATFVIGRLVFGGDFQIEPHEQIEMIKDFTQPAIQAAILVSGALVTPFFEEVLFRGLIQTTIRSYNIRPWPAIVLTSIVFTLLHPSGLQPAVFVLGMLLGYAYERSGSLFRPMFIHALFNGMTLIAAISRSG